MSHDGAVAADATPQHVGQVASGRASPLSELRPAYSGLEDMFLQLTADTQREGKNRERKSA